MKYKLVTRCLLLFYASVLLITIALSATWYGIKRQFYNGLIPEQIELGLWFNHSGRYHLFSGCGAAVFSITKSTSNAIKTKGIAFFDQARTSRNISRRQTKRHYSKWRLTEQYKSIFTEGPPTGLSCAGYHPFSIVMMEIRKGNFYISSDGHGYLIILPEIELAVLSYWD